MSALEVTGFFEKATFTCQYVVADTTTKVRWRDACASR